ncbi:MAG: alpha/beta fold hydrolase [Burkholderia gladioli]
MLNPSGRDDTLALFCLPYAGGSATVFRDWQARMPAWLELVPLNLPGRGVRQRMAPLHRLDELIAVLIDDMRPRLDRPFAIFGHSMGALVGFELAQALRRVAGVSPRWLGVSACRAPSRRERETHWLTCPEPEFLDEVRALNGMPDELLDNREFMELVMPMLRADFHLCGTYEPQPARPRLTCPMLVIGGARDAELAGDPANLAAWADETAGPVVHREIDAGHFFINTHREELIGHVLDSLATVRGPGRLAGLAG